MQILLDNKYAKYITGQCQRDVRSSGILRSVRHFGTLGNIQKSVTDELKVIPAEAFQHCYEQWKQRLRRCVVAQGNYFEGDNLDL
jgi:hypothetical protein